MSFLFFFSSRRRHTRFDCDWSSDVCSSDLLILLMAGSRFTYRIWKEHRLYSPLAALGEPVLVLGAGEAGARLTKELAHSQIGRAACRGRGEISGVAGSFKKKKRR